MDEGEGEVKFNIADDDEDWRCVDTNVIPFPLLISQREIGPRFNHSTTKNLENWREESFVHRAHSHLQCEIPPLSKTTYLLAFSPDGTKVASSHGDHNIYVTDVKSGKNICTLKGHPRSPWCVAFHPSSNEIVASGCLGGEVRVWDLKGGREIWSPDNKGLTDKKTVIASLAFHPTDQVLVIATENEIYFWNWFRPEPFAKICTASKLEKVKYVEFDPLGYKLITGIAIVRRERHPMDSNRVGHNASNTMNNNSEENMPSDNGPLLRGSHSRAAHRIYRILDRGFRNSFNQTSGVDMSDNSSSNSNPEHRVSPEIERLENENGHNLGPRVTATANTGEHFGARRRNIQAQSAQSNSSNRLEEEGRIAELRTFPRPVSDDSASSSSLDSSSSVTSGVSGASNERNTRLSLLWTSRLNRTGGNESDNSAGGTFDLEERRGEGSVMRGGTRNLEPLEEREAVLPEFPLTIRDRQTSRTVNDSDTFGVRSISFERESEDGEVPLSSLLSNFQRTRERRLTSRGIENGNHYRGRIGSISESERDLDSTVPSSETAWNTPRENRPSSNLETGNVSSNNPFFLDVPQSGSFIGNDQEENENGEDSNEVPLNRFRSSGQGGRWMYYRGKFPGGAPSRNRGSTSNSSSQRTNNDTLSSVSRSTPNNRTSSEDPLAVPGPSGLSGSSSLNGQGSVSDPFLSDNSISSSRLQNRAQMDPHFGVHLLSRHIENMQSICRSLSIPRAQYELTTRQGNEISQLQQIRSMLYDIQHQIRSLRASVDQHILEEYFSLSDDTLNSTSVNPEPLGNELEGSGRGMTDEIELEVNIEPDETDQFSYTTLAEEDPDQLPSNLSNSFENSTQTSANESGTLEPIPELDSSSRISASTPRISRSTRATTRTTRNPPVPVPRVRTRRNLRNQLVWTGLLRRLPPQRRPSRLRSPPQRRPSRLRSHTSAVSSTTMPLSSTTDAVDVGRSSRRREIREARLDKRRTAITARRSERRSHEESGRSGTLLQQPCGSSSEQNDEMNIRRRHSGDWQRRLRSIVAMDQQREQDAETGPSGSSRSAASATNGVSNTSRVPEVDNFMSSLCLQNHNSPQRSARPLNNGSDVNGTENNNTREATSNTSFQNGHTSISTTTPSSSSSSSCFRSNGSQSSQNPRSANEFHPALEDSLSERASRTGPPTTSLSSRIATMLAQQREARVPRHRLFPHERESSLSRLSSRSRNSSLSRLRYEIIQARYEDAISRRTRLSNSSRNLPTVSRTGENLDNERETNEGGSQIAAELESSINSRMESRLSRRNRFLRRYPSLVSGGDLADATLAEISPELESEQNRRESYRHGRRESYRRMLQLMADRLNHMMNTSLSNYSLLREFDTEDEEGEVMEHQNLRQPFNQRRMGTQRGSSDTPSRGNGSLFSDYNNGPSPSSSSSSALNRHMQNLRLLVRLALHLIYQLLNFICNQNLSYEERPISRLPNPFREENEAGQSNQRNNVNGTADSNSESNTFEMDIEPGLQNLTALLETVRMASEELRHDANSNLETATTLRETRQRSEGPLNRRNAMTGAEALTLNTVRAPEPSSLAFTNAYPSLATSTPTSLPSRPESSYSGSTIRRRLTDFLIRTGSYSLRGQTPNTNDTSVDSQRRLSGAGGTDGEINGNSHIQRPLPTTPAVRLRDIRVPFLIPQIVLNDGSYDGAHVPQNMTAGSQESLSPINDDEAFHLRTFGGIPLRFLGRQNAVDRRSPESEDNNNNNNNNDNNNNGDVIETDRSFSRYSPGRHPFRHWNNLPYHGAVPQSPYMIPPYSYLGNNISSNRDSDVNYYNQPFFSLAASRNIAGSFFDPYSPGLCNANNTLYRIQAWDFKHHDIPDISDNYSNIVVQRCRIHFDASVSISSDGTLLAAVLPDTKTITRIGVYSLETKTLGQLLYSSNIGFNIVCVSLSPTMKHLVVGISSHRLGIHHNDKQVIGRIYKLVKSKASSKKHFTGILRFCKSIELQSEFRQSSLNCIRWIPNPGQGLVYGTNRGQLTIIR